MSDLFTKDNETSYLVKKDSNGKIRCVILQRIKERDDYFVIKRTTFQYGGKMTAQPDIVITEGKAKRDPSAQATLQYNAKLKEYKDKGYKELEKHPEDYTITEINEILPEVTTDSNGFSKHMLAKSSDKVKQSSIDKVKYWYASRKIDGCFDGKTLITTDKGPIRIDKIVNEKLKVNVLSYNHTTNKLEYKPIINWFDNGTDSSKNFVKIKLGDRKYLTCTKNHKFYTNGEYKPIISCDALYKKAIPINKFNSLFLGSILGDGCLAFDYRTKLSFRYICSHKELKLLKHTVEVLGLEGTYKEYTSGYGSKCWNFTSSALTNKINLDLFYVKNNIGRYERLFYTAEYLNSILDDSGVSLWVADDGSISYNNGNKETPILCISTEGLEYDQVIEFQRFFTIKYGITPDLIVDKRKVNEKQAGIKLKFRTKCTLQLLDILKNHKFKTVEYKYFYDSGKYEESNIGLEKVWPEILDLNESNKRHKYDIEVADNHNYFAEGFLVHNCRCSFYWDGKRILTASRGGGTYEYSTQHITQNPKFIEFFKKHPDYVLDGELYKHGKQLQEISGAARLEKNAVDCDWLEYYIYDIMLPDKTFYDRLQILKEIKEELNLGFDPYKKWNDGDLQIQMVPQEKVSGYDNIMDLHNKYVEEGWEGVVIRNPDKVYGFGKRTNDMIKVKRYKDSEFLVVGYELGLRGVEDMVFICETPNGKTFKAKPTGDKLTKEEYINNFDSKYKNHIATVKYFYYSNGNDEVNGVPLQPCLKAFREKIDM